MWIRFCVFTDKGYENVFAVLTICVHTAAWTPNTGIDILLSLLKFAHLQYQTIKHFLHWCHQAELIFICKIKCLRTSVKHLFQTSSEIALMDYFIEFNAEILFCDVIFVLPARNVCRIIFNFYDNMHMLHLSVWLIW